MNSAGQIILRAFLFPKTSEFTQFSGGHWGINADIDPDLVLADGTIIPKTDPAKANDNPIAPSPGPHHGESVSLPRNQAMTAVPLLSFHIWLSSAAMSRGSSMSTALAGSGGGYNRKRLGAFL